MVCHRRAGKTVGCVADLICDAIFTKKPDARFAYVAPHFNQAKDIAWQYVKRLSADIRGVEFNESELRVDYPTGGRVRLYGADNQDRLRGLYLDGVVLDEYAEMRPSVWGEIIRPMLVDRKGWAAFIGTPKGKNEFWRICQQAKSDPDWLFVNLPASLSGIIPAEELAAARKDMTDSQYEQEMECSFEAAIQGAYYGKEMVAAEQEGRIKLVPYDPLVPVHTFWDLGIGDSTSIWFLQFVGRELHWIDYYENTGEGAAHYAKTLQNKPYVYGEHWGPHDAAAREWGSGKSRLEQLAELGIKMKLCPNIGVADGINAVRLVLPRCWFDAAKCKDGLEALRQYRTEWDADAKVFRDKPLHDWTSHAADAARMAAVAYREQTGEAPRPFQGFEHQTLNQLWPKRRQGGRI